MDEFRSLCCLHYSSVVHIVAGSGGRRKHGSTIDSMNVVSVEVVVDLISFLLMDFTHRAGSNTGINISIMFVDISLVYFCCSN